MLTYTNSRVERVEEVQKQMLESIIFGGCVLHTAMFCNCSLLFFFARELRCIWPIKNKFTALLLGPHFRRFL